MYISAGISYPLKDKSWPGKLIVAGLINLIPFVGQITLLGYLIKVIRTTSQEKVDRLPGWSDWG